MKDFLEGLPGEVLAQVIESDPNAFVVGGAVRDHIMGKEGRADLDLAIAGNGIEVSRSIASALGREVSFVPLDVETGVGRIVVRRKGSPTIDICSLKGTTITEDLLHRDFTLNAMAISLRDVMGDNVGNIVDPLGGRADLSRGVLRVCSSSSFSEDPLRVLRAIRFAILFDLNMTAETSRLLRLAIPELLSVAPERLRDELFLILSSDCAAQGLREMESHGILDVLFPELIPCRSFTQNAYHHLDVLQHCLETVECLERILDDLPAGIIDLRAAVSAYVNEEPVKGRPKKGLLKLAALLHDSGKPVAAATDEDGRLHFIGHEIVSKDIANQVMKRLRLGRKERDVGELLVGGHMRASVLKLPTVSLRAFRKMLRYAGNDIVGLTLLALADAAATRGPASVPLGADRASRGASQVLRYFLEAPPSTRKPFLSGTDLIEHLGMQQGPQIGRILRQLAEMQDEGIIGSREDALSQAAKLLGPCPIEATPRAQQLE